MNYPAHLKQKMFKTITLHDTKLPTLFVRVKAFKMQMMITERDGSGDKSNYKLYN